MNNLSVKELPESLQDVAETIGLGIALKLVAHFGGTELSFPKKPSDDHPVVLALGKEDGSTVCKYFTGQLFYVPHLRPRKSARRDVLALQGEGKGRSEIARTLGISQRHVRRMANKPEPKDQFKLFED